jgi:hypothetical protein
MTILRWGILGRSPSRRSTSTRPRVENLTAATLDGAPPRLDLQFSRGTIAALVDLDRAARLNAGLPTD